MDDFVQNIRRRLATLREIVADLVSLEDWIADGGRLEDLEPHWSADPAMLLGVAEAWGYLKGAADANDQTVLELLESCDVAVGTGVQIATGVGESW